MRESNPRTKPPRRAWIGLTVVVLAFASFATLSRLPHPLDRELRELPTATRGALYHRTLETLRAECTRANGPSLTAYCREQAEFVERFPECGDGCRALTNSFAPPPSR